MFIVFCCQANTLLGNRIAHLESTLSKGKVHSIDQAKKFNEYGVILAVYGDYKYVEELLLEQQSGGGVKHGASVSHFHP